MQRAKRRRSDLFVALGLVGAWLLAQWAEGTETTLGAVTGAAILLATGTVAMIKWRRQRNRLDTTESLTLRDS